MRGKCPKCGHARPRKRSEASKVSLKLKEKIKTMRKVVKSGKAGKEAKEAVASAMKLVTKLESLPPAPKQSTREDKIAEARALVDTISSMK